jgi:uncharacterized membrane protein
MRPLEVALIMTITVTLTFASIEDAITNLARIRNEGAAPAVVKEADPKPAAAAKAKAEPKPAAAEKKDAASTPTAESKANGAAPTETAKTSDPAKDYEPVGAAIKNAVASGKRPQVVEVLAGFGAASGKDLKPEHFGDFMTKLSKALEAPADLG